MGVTCNELRRSVGQGYLHAVLEAAGYLNIAPEKAVAKF